ncbi:hypothetical protein [Bacillus sp. FJAT-44742]|uniref:hypothetical protein n=1 Tax=Bacillus sp. FJAT-44742 TaxID=2014005 RepID=UPI000C24A14A|nr:hypothetical protein [Bacillus sp. FJAT-44742]
MKYWIAFAQAVDNKATLRVKRTLSEEELHTINACKDKISLFQGIKSLFQITVGNYSSLKNSIGNLEKKMKEESSWNKDTVFLEINRMLVNYISTAAMFENHAEKSIHEEYGDAAPQLISFNEQRDKEFDNHFAYRFFSELQAFIQEKGLPKGRIKPSGESEESLPKMIYIKDSLLLPDFEWDEKVVEDFRDKPKAFDIYPDLDQNYHSLIRVYQRVLAILAKETIKAIGTYNKLIGEFHQEFEEEGVLVVVQGELKGDGTEKLINLPGREIKDTIDELKRFKILKDKDS